MFRVRVFLLFAVITLSCTMHPSVSFAQAAEPEVSTKTDNSDKDTHLPLGIELYQPTYVMPLYYTHKPYYKMYKNRTPRQYNKSKKREKLSAWDFKFQLSFDVPIAKRLFWTDTGLYFAYSQVSYWQLYVSNSYFRETNYQPELFVTHRFSPLFSLTTGAVHQSNGVGDMYERAWNRVYAEGKFTGENWLVSVKAWEHIYRDDEEYNSNIMHYLGYGQLLASYRIWNTTASVFAYNFIESGLKRGTFCVSLSHPISDNARIYMTYFNGYGQSLIEYDHRVQSAGLGISLNDWR